MICFTVKRFVWRIPRKNYVFQFLRDALSKYLSKPNQRPVSLADCVGFRSLAGD